MPASRGEQAAAEEASRLLREGLALLDEREREVERILWHAEEQAHAIVLGAEREARELTAVAEQHRLHLEEEVAALRAQVAAIQAELELLRSAQLSALVRPPAPPQPAEAGIPYRVPAVPRPAPPRLPTFDVGTPAEVGLSTPDALTVTPAPKPPAIRAPLPTFQPPAADPASSDVLPAQEELVVDEPAPEAPPAPETSPEPVEIVIESTTDPEVALERAEAAAETASEGVEAAAEAVAERAEPEADLEMGHDTAEAEGTAEPEAPAAEVAEPLAAPEAAQTPGLAPEPAPEPAEEKLPPRRSKKVPASIPAPVPEVRPRNLTEPVWGRRPPRQAIPTRTSRPRWLPRWLPFLLIIGPLLGMLVSNLGTRDTGGVVDPRTNLVGASAAAAMGPDPGFRAVPVVPNPGAQLASSQAAAQPATGQVAAAQSVPALAAGGGQPLAAAAPATADSSSEPATFRAAMTAPPQRAVVVPPQGATLTQDSPIVAVYTTYTTYTVRPGDTLNQLAARFGVSGDGIIRATGLPDPNLLVVGQVLTIPRDSGWLYRVQSDESLEQIAVRFGTSVADLVSSSMLESAAVRAGDVVFVPNRGSLSQP